MNRLVIAMAPFFMASAGLAAEAAGPPAPPALSTGTTANPSLADDSPYVELYKIRVEQAELNHKRIAALNNLALLKLERGRKLFSRNALSREEYDVLIAEASATTADKGLAAKRVEEAKTFLKIVTGLVRRGVSIPLCTYEME
jgi:hypothetical protein